MHLKFLYFNSNCEYLSICLYRLIFCVFCDNGVFIVEAEHFCVGRADNDRPIQL